VNAHPSIADIRYRTGWDRTTIMRALRRLEDGKLIVRDGVTKEGCTRWVCSMELRRDPGDRAEIEREEEEHRAGAKERKRRSRSKAVTHSESVTGEDVTGAEGVTVTGVGSVTDLDVTHSKGVTEAAVTDAESVTGAVVTDFKSGRHTLKVCDNSDVTDFTPGRHGLNATRTTHEPSKELTVLEPPCSETPPPSESPRLGEQTTKDNTKPADSSAKRSRTAKPKIERTPERQEIFEAANKIGKWWWDVRCPNLGISVKETHRFPGFRKFLEDFLNASPPCTPQEVQQALEDCTQSWPSNTAFEKAISARRGVTQNAHLGATGTDGRRGDFGPRSQVNKVDWSKGFNMGGDRR
jgi:hypothetical protein